MAGRGFWIGRKSSRIHFLRAEPDPAAGRCPRLVFQFPGASAHLRWPGVCLCCLSKQAAFVWELWPLYRMSGHDRSDYRVIPGYAKEGRGGFGGGKARGVTFNCRFWPRTQARRWR